MSVTGRCRRWREHIEETATPGCSTSGGASGAIHRVPMETAEQVLALYREKYFDFNVRHFHEKLARSTGI